MCWIISLDAWKGSDQIQHPFFVTVEIEEMALILKKKKDQLLQTFSKYYSKCQYTNLLLF